MAKFRDRGFAVRFIMVAFFVLLGFEISIAGGKLTSKELLECRDNLTKSVKNDEIFLRKVNEADYIFTGKIKELKNGVLHVRVKRAIKGLLNSTLDLTLNDTCSAYVRRSYTGIFMGKRKNAGLLGEKVLMHFGPVPLTLTNLDRLNAAVRGKFYEIDFDEIFYYWQLFIYFNFNAMQS